MKKIQLSIPEPCHENWQKMTPNEQGRFCLSCQKTVIDFTAMSDVELINFFTRPKENVCGRLLPAQLNQDLKLPRKPLPWLRQMVAVALPALLLGAKVHAQKGKLILGDTVLQQRPSMTESSLQGTAGGVQAAISTNKKKPLTGIVYNAEGLPLQGAWIEVKGRSVKTQTDSAGQFVLPSKKWRGETLQVGAVGYEPIQLKVKDEDFVKLQLTQAKLSGEVIVVGFVKPKKSCAKPKPSVTRKLMDSLFRTFSVYPNPVASSAALTIVADRMPPGRYTVTIVSAAGQVVHNEQRVLQNKNENWQVPLNALAAGAYIVSLQQEGGKRFTQKLVVQ